MIKVLIESSEYVAEELIRTISVKQVRNAWKGLLLGKIHSSRKIKKFVQDIMVDLKLSKDVTLSEFHAASKKKITLNFSVINTGTNSIEIFNYHTRPYMPVWAAVVATSSLIQFFEPLHDKNFWSYRLLSDF